MKCTAIQVAGGTAIVCSRGRRPKQPTCSECSRPSKFQCDGPSSRKSSGTCDRHLCERCTTQSPGANGDTLDLCSRCKESLPRMEKKLRKAEAAARQLDLFNQGAK